MQTLNFQCGHCSGVMAVSAEYLGQQVRCPHCQQVVIAPSSVAPEPAPVPEPPMAPAPSFDLERHDDIFSHEEGGHGDALFGNGEAPRINLPLEPAPAPAPEPPAPPPQLEPEQPDNGVAAPWLTTGPSEARPESVAPHLVQHAATPPPSPDTGSQEPAPESALSVPRKARTAEGSAMFLPLLLIPLFLYAAGMTGLAVFLYLRIATKEKSLFEEMPDVDGDNPGIRKGGRPARIIKPKPLEKLPEHLHVGLGKSLRLGDLEVTPLGIERRKVSVWVKGSDKPEPCDNESLVLRLKLKNLSKDYAFTPIDNYFDRWYTGGSNAPLTVLIAGNAKFYGGPAKWYEQGSSRNRRQWVDGRKDTDPVGLEPGESMETFVCTDGDDQQAAATLIRQPNHKGPLLWRVNLRRGLIEYNGRKYPAQCVIGVPFSLKDVTDS